MGQHRTRARHIPWLAALGAAAMLVLGGCAAEPDYCRHDPGDCGGGIGGFCDFDGDCQDGYCCRTDNCGGGMCTYECRDSRDCPADMACEHDQCFFACNDDTDCARGMSCEHDGVCEWD